MPSFTHDSPLEIQALLESTLSSDERATIINPSLIGASSDPSADLDFLQPALKSILDNAYSFTNPTQPLWDPFLLSDTNLTLSLIHI